MRFLRPTRIAPALALAGLAGCSLPPQRADFSSPDPQERTLAVAQAARQEDRGSIPHLILALESSDPAQRMLAIGALERLTGQTLGFEYWAPLPARDEAIARWKSWWLQNGAPHGEPKDASGPGIAQATPSALSP